MLLKLLRRTQMFFPLLLALAQIGSASTDPLSGCLGTEIGRILRKDLPEGPVLVIRSEDRTRRLEEIPILKIMNFNMENLKEAANQFHVDPKTGKNSNLLPVISKGLHRLNKEVELITQYDPDIAALQEIGSLNILNTLDVMHLGDKYKRILVEGNSIRQQHIGFLVKKDLPFDVYAYSHRNLLDASGAKLFSRDLPVLLFRPKGAPADSPPIFEIASTHYKSKRDEPGDPQSIIKRTDQANKTPPVLESQQKVFALRTPALLIGDFNTEVGVAPELTALKQAGYKDSLELKGGLSDLQEATHTYIENGKPPVYHQMDAQYLSQEAQQAGILKDTHVIRNRASDGTELPLPRTHKERRANGSDHFPVVGDYGVPELRQAYSKAMKAYEATHPSQP